MRARFVKPTVDEVAAHVRAKGYTFDPVSFWNYYESNGWKVGRNTMKSWTSACVTWQRKEGKPQTVAPEGPGEADRFLMECMARSQSDRKDARHPAPGQDRRILPEAPMGDIPGLVDEGSAQERRVLHRTAQGPRRAPGCRS